MLDQRPGQLIPTVDNLSSKLTQVGSSLVVTKTVDNELLKRVTSLERGLHTQEQ